jgi:hypothetical protein
MAATVLERGVVGAEGNDDRHVLSVVLRRDNPHR